MEVCEDDGWRCVRMMVRSEDDGWRYVRMMVGSV